LEIEKVKIIGFLQNAYKLSSDLEKQRYLEDQTYHKERLSLAQTGKRIITIFEEPLFKFIYWDNVSTDCCQGEGRINYYHVGNVIKRENPHIILAFGKVASRCLKNINYEYFNITQNFKIIHGFHPSRCGYYKLGLMKDTLISVMKQLQED